MKKQDSIIITEPHLTYLFTGQLLDPEVLPKIVKHIGVDLEDIKYIPYDADEHEVQIKRSRKQYGNTILTKKYYTIFDEYSLGYNL